MKTKKGFTLIELLAVIVILAVIALITIYIIGDVIEQAKIKKYYSEEKSMETAAGLYLVKNEGMLDRVIDSQEITLRTLVDSEVMKAVHDSGNGGLCDQDQSKVIVNVDKEKRLVTYTGCLKCSNYKTKNEDCGFAPDEIVDETPCQLATDGDVYYIDSEEDLYAFSLSVNSGNNYSGKTVKLRKNLDMSKSISIINSSCKNVTSFDPIGNNKNSSNRFAGTFDGDGYYIKNLTINKPDDNYVGLIGYLTGVIKGINIENISVTGKNYVGGVVGQITGTSKVHDIKITGTVSGNNSVGGVNGQLGSSNSTIKNILSNVNVIGNQFVGGIVGNVNGNSSSISGGIIEGGTITASSYSNYVGGGYGYDQGSCGSVYTNTNVTLNGSNMYMGGQSGCSGKGFENTYLGRLNGYDQILDTYIGGDNDSSGYYFDYDANKNIIVKSTSKNPLPQLSKLKGAGTESNPYKISSIADWNVAVVYPTGKNYELTADIDFNNEEIYILGTINNKFTETFEGNGYRIKNAKVLGMNYTGLIGYSNGTIKGLNIENITANGKNYVGGVLGYISGVDSNNKSVVSDVAISGNITGDDSIGGIVGILGNSNTTIKQVLSNVNVTGNESVGGIVGDVYGNSSSISSGVVEGGTITASSYSNYVGGGYGYNQGSCSNVYASTNVTLNGSNMYMGGQSGCSGNGFEGTNNNNLSYYDSNLGLESYINGDKDSSGYYFDYNTNWTDIEVIKVGTKPVATLEKTGDKQAKLQCSDDKGIVSYYFGKASPTPNSTYQTVTQSTAFSKTQNVTESGTYYLACKDTDGRMSNIASKNFNVEGVFTEIGTCSDDKEPPTCTFSNFYPLSTNNGMHAAFTCTDNVDVTGISSYFDSTRRTAAASFKQIGTIKAGTKIEKGMSHDSTWTAETDPSNPPSAGICYYFHYGAEDACHNFSAYVTTYCLNY